MSNEDLNRAKEIQEELYTLQGALSQLNKVTIFNCDESVRCSGYRGDAFLSEVHIHIKNVGVQKLNNRISELKKEFTKL